MAKLSLHADDLGASLSHGRAILHCYDAGALDGASLLVTRPEVLAATVEGLAGRPGLALRLHLNLSEGRPVCSPDRLPLLCRGDCFRHSWLSLAWLWWSGDRAVRQQLEAQLRLEMEAQLEVFRDILRQLGRPARALVDGHEHFQLLPFVRRQLPVDWARLGCGFVYFSDLPSRAGWLHRIRGLWHSRAERQLWTGTVHPGRLSGRLVEATEVEVLFHPRGPLQEDEFRSLGRRHRLAYEDPARLLEYRLLLDWASHLGSLRESGGPRHARETSQRR